MNYFLIVFLALMSTASFCAMNEPFDIGQGLYVRILSVEPDGSENIQVYGAESLNHAYAVRVLYESRCKKIVRTIQLPEIPHGLTIFHEE
jgi:hypothetical protein